MMEMIHELYMKNRTFVSDDYDYCLEYIHENELPLAIHEYESGTEIWDSWTIPEKWIVNHGYIESPGGQRVLSFDDHPLHLISYSAPFEGWVTREQLLEHVHTHGDNPEAIPFHFRQMYRPWENEWGFCASQAFVNGLEEEEYYVSIDTEFERDAMKVAEHHLSGQTDDVILLVAHLDHPGMANDDLAGVAAALEVMRRLRELTERRFSYKLLIVQEIIGTAAYLAEREAEWDDFVYGVFHEMLGVDNRLLLQRTFEGDTKLDSVAEAVLDEQDPDGRIAGYREVVGNDELILEGPGIEIPTISVSRFPYAEYHTHFDDPSIVSEDRLESGVEYVLSVLDVLERDFQPRRLFDGVPSLANPKYDLYLDPGQVLTTSAEDAQANREFRNRFLRHLEGDESAFDIADRFDVSFEFVHEYLREFEQKGLIETAPAPLDSDVDSYSP